MAINKRLYQYLIFFGILFSSIILSTNLAALECINEEECSVQLKKIAKYARRGSPHAQILMGALYSEGDLVKQDFHKSFKWYRKAAKQRPAIGLANHKTALAYFDGRGTKKNNKKAFKYLNKAASTNYVDSQLLLGVLYFDGKETSKDLVQSKYWLNLAVENNDSRAAYMLGEMAEFGVGGDINIEEAKRLYFLSANKKYEKAIDKLQQLKLIPQDRVVEKNSTSETNSEIKIVSNDVNLNIEKGEVIVIYGNDLPVLEMMDITLKNIKDMKVYSTQWTGSHIPGHGCGDSMTHCTIITDRERIYDYMRPGLY